MTAFAVLLAFLAGVLGAWLYLRHATTALPVAVTTAATAQALAEERERIYADLHDDLGAKLLQLIHTANDPRQADLARAVLQDLRDVVTRSRGEPGTLGDVRDRDSRRCTRGRLRRVICHGFPLRAISDTLLACPGLNESDDMVAEGNLIGIVIR